MKRNKKLIIVGMIVFVILIVSMPKESEHNKYHGMSNDEVYDSIQKDIEEQSSYSVSVTEEAIDATIPPMPTATPFVAPEGDLIYSDERDYYEEDTDGLDISDDTGSYYVDGKWYDEDPNMTDGKSPYGSDMGEYGTY